MAILPTQEEIVARFESAPEYVRNFITSVELMATFKTLREVHKLHLDEAGQVGRALNAVFLEIRPASEFPELLRSSLEQNVSVYDALLKDINEKIFKVFREKMETKPPTPTPVTPTPPATPPSTIGKLEATITKQPQSVVVSTLTEKNDVISKPTTTPTPPQRHTYTNDPYREPVE